MLCSECGKKKATIHLTKIINNVKIDLHLCQACANNNSEHSIQLDMPFSFHNLLSGLLNFDTSLNNPGKSSSNSESSTSSAVPSKETHKKLSKCSNCGLTYSQFSKWGRLGCAHCYSSFSESLVPLLRRIHGHTSHCGKVPEQIRDILYARREIEQLKNELAIKVQQEEFEEAATLRDQIKALQNNTQSKQE